MITVQPDGVGHAGVHLRGELDGIDGFRTRGQRQGTEQQFGSTLEQHDFYAYDFYNNWTNKG